MIVLSFLACGSRAHCPGGSLYGRELNTSQKAAVQRIESLTKVFFSAPFVDEALSAKLVDTFSLVHKVNEAEPGSRVPYRTRTSHDSFRSPFAKVEGNFDPTPYLGVFDAAAFVEPDLLLLPEPRGSIPATYQGGQAL